MSILKSVIYRAGQPIRRLQGHRPPEIDPITVSISALPSVFDGYRLAVVSDLHLPDCLSSPAQVLAVIDEVEPDAILLPGDITNRHSRFLPDETAAFLRALSQRAPTFAVTGNHEQKAAYLPTFRSLATAAGVTLLENTVCELRKDRQALPLYGLCDSQDSAFLPDTPSLLLCHYPQVAAKQAARGFSLAVCGHAHGGQLRFGGRGLYAPGQGFFPRYTSGLYQIGSMQMVVSRGLGDSSLPLRYHNPPHLPVILLRVG